MAYIRFETVSLPPPLPLWMRELSGGRTLNWRTRLLPSRVIRLIGRFGGSPGGSPSNPLHLPVDGEKAPRG
jgi:hypothetical protein